jgi:hypothetical protein
MEITRKIFWREALKGGTIIGLVSIAFALLKYALTPVEAQFWIKLIVWVDFLVFIALIYAFTRKISRSADRAQGFSYNRCVGFVVAMMLFHGFLFGVYLAIFNNFIDPESVKTAIDAAAVGMQDILQGEQFDAYYSTMKWAMFNPLMLVFSHILSAVIGGLIVGLFVSAITKRNPDIFAVNNQ